MLTQAFYYFLLIGELAILGLLIAGIYSKLKTILKMYRLPADDQNFEHSVSKFDHCSGFLVDMSTECPTDGFLEQSCEARPNQASSLTRH